MVLQSKVGWRRASRENHHAALILPFLTAVVAAEDGDGKEYILQIVHLCFTVSIVDSAHSSALCIDSKRAPGHEVIEMLQKI